MISLISDDDDDDDGDDDDDESRHRQMFLGCVAASLILSRGDEVHMSHVLEAGEDRWII